MTEITPEQMEKYKRQAMAYAKKATPPPTEPTASAPPPEAPPDVPALPQGTLRVQTFAARGAFPVRDAEVVVTENDTVLYRLKTNSSGIAEGIILPAKNTDLSQEAATAQDSGMQYTVTVHHPDYASATRMIEIYTGVESLLPIELIPKRKGGY
ncbi:MAG: hypothetical protein MJ132_06610 [Clostridia bacterium]|nr:hypothetical protein [Clostridia bacterium]